MKVLLRIVAVVFVVVAAFLVYAVVHAMSSAGGARPAVAVGYAVAAALLTFFAAKLWRRRAPTVSA